MRNYINIINEALRPTKMAEPSTKPFADPEPMDFDIHVDDNGPANIATVGEPKSKEPVRLNLADRGKTHTALSRANIPAHNVGNILRDLENMNIEDDEISDEEAFRNAYGDVDNIDTTGYDTPRTADNLPAVMKAAIIRVNDTDVPDHFNPEWHQIKHLPGYMKNAIRQIGRKVFSNFTTTPIEDIQMMASLLNGERDVRMMMSWIKEHGHREDAMNFDFSEHMPEYAAIAGVAESQIWRAEGYEFLLMRDNGGYYVYAWPENNKQIVGNGQRMIDNEF